MYCPEIKYDGYTFPNVFGPYTFSTTPTDLSFSCNFLIQKVSSSELISEENAMLAVVKNVKKTLSISFNGASAQTFSHSTTGFNARVLVAKLKDSNLSTATSRPYSLSCNIELPYTQDNGRIQANMVIKYEDTRTATAIFTMVYSANSSIGSQASTVYSTDTWDLSMLSTFLTGRVMEKISENISQDQNAKRCSVTKVYKEVIYSEATSESAKLSIVNAEYTYSFSYLPTKGVFLASSSKIEQKAILVLNLKFTGKIDKERVDSTGLTSLYKNSIKPTMIDKAVSILALAKYQDYTNPALFLMSESVNIDPSSSMINVAIEIGCKSDDIHFMSVSEVLTIIDESGLRYNKLWDGQEGTYYIYSLGSTKFLLRNITISQVDGQPTIPALTEGWGLTGKDGGWELIKRLETFSATKKGIKETTLGAYVIYTKSYSETYIYINKAKSVVALIGSEGVGSKSEGVF